MKKLFIILSILMSFNCLSQTDTKPFLQKNEDKVNHFSCGYIIGFASNCITYEITKNKHIAFWSGLGLSILAGHLKENFDKHHNGSYDKNDLLATSIGGFSGSITIRIIIGKSVHRSRATMEMYFSDPDWNGRVKYEDIRIIEK